LERPPEGTENCKDCTLLNRLLDVEQDLRQKDALLLLHFPELRNQILTRDYQRLKAGLSWKDEGQLSPPAPTVWDIWDFGPC
jgi:hypothetical protein